MSVIRAGNKPTSEVRDEWVESLSDALIEYGIESNERKLVEAFAAHTAAAAMLNRLRAERSRRQAANPLPDDAA